MDYTNAYTYVSMYGYVRPDNTAFDKPFDDVDWSQVSISGLDGGKIIESGPPAILKKPKSKRLKQFVSVVESAS
jgi:hypothetical protein